MDGNLAIIYGGNSCEKDISIITALTIYNSIKSVKKCQLIFMQNGQFYIGDGLNNISSYSPFNPKKFTEIFLQRGGYVYLKFGKKFAKISAVINCCHGGSGENGALSGLLEIADLPYTSCGVLSSAICMDKCFCKLMLEKFKFPTVEYCIYSKGGSIEKVEALGYPLIIKPSRLGSSVGISYANNREELNEGLELSLKFDNKLLIEKALTDFSEYNCAVVGGDVNPIVSEIEQPIITKKFLNFDDKYMNTEIKREIPAKLPPKVRQKVIRYSSEIYRLFDCRGVIRVDYLFVNDILYVNEINTVPGSLANYLFKNMDIDTATLIDYMVDDAVISHRKNKELLTEFSSDVLSQIDVKKIVECNNIKK